MVLVVKLIVLCLVDLALIPSHLVPCSSQWSPRISSNSITWVFGRNAKSQAPTQTYCTKICILTGTQVLFTHITNRKHPSVEIKFKSILLL